MKRKPLVISVLVALGTFILIGGGGGLIEGAVLGLGLGGIVFVILNRSKRDTG